MGEAQHTPTPWSVQECDEIWCDTDGRPNAPLFKPDAQYRRWGREVNREQREANAAFIVHAVNSHATLTAALREARGALADCEEIICFQRDKVGCPGEGDGFDRHASEENWPGSWNVVYRARTALATINAALGRTGGS